MSLNSPSSLSFIVSEDIKILNYRVEKEAVGMRLDIFLSERVADWSRSRLKKLIDDGNVLVNGGVAKSSFKLRKDDQVSVELVLHDSDNFEPEDIPLDIVFEDEYLAVINKPAGMIVHPGAGVSSGTLANAVAFRFYQNKLPQRRKGAKIEKQVETRPLGSVQNAQTLPQKDIPQRRKGAKIEKQEETRPQGSVQEALALEQQEIRDPQSAIRNRIGIVHRLDKDTSGLIVVAKNELTNEKLSAQFRDRKVTKSYVALVHGFVRKLSGKINEPIARDRKNRVKMAVEKKGRNAISIYKVRRRFEKFTLLDVNIKTGRTHQIRVHLSHINHPIVGDATYNEGRDKQIADAQLRKAIGEMKRFFLHAEKLAFTHPVTKNLMEFVQPLPTELTKLLKLL